MPFTDLITQIPTYTKFLKDILNRKHEVKVVETVALTEECSAILQNKSPPKLKDPGSFSIPCDVGPVSIDNALCDLGASVSVMPLSVCRKLGMGPLKFTNITLQMADRTVKYPRGILEDVPVRVGKFFIPVDFVVLDMDEDDHIPIILGRPFLHTAGANIDVKNGSLTLTVGDDKVTFNLNAGLKHPMIQQSCYAICTINKIVRTDPPRSPNKDLLEAPLNLNSVAGDKSVEHEDDNKPETKRTHHKRRHKSQDQRCSTETLNCDGLSSDLVTYSTMVGADGFSRLIGRELSRSFDPP